MSRRFETHLQKGRFKAESAEETEERAPENKHLSKTVPDSDPDLISPRSCQRGNIGYMLTQVVCVLVKNNGGQT